MFESTALKIPMAPNMAEIIYKTMAALRTDNPSSYQLMMNVLQIRVKKIFFLLRLRRITLRTKSIIGIAKQKVKLKMKLLILIHLKLNKMQTNTPITMHLNRPRRF